MLECQAKCRMAYVWPGWSVETSTVFLGVGLSVGSHATCLIMAECLSISYLLHYSLLFLVLVTNATIIIVVDFWFGPFA